MSIHWWRRGCCLAASVLIGLPSPSSAQVEYTKMRGDGKDVRMTKLADGVYQFMTLRDGYVRQINSVAVVTDRDVFVFDTDTRPSTARYILGEIRKITTKPVRYLVNSHGHPDHWSGNEVYAQAYPDVDIIASAVIRDFMQRTLPLWPPRFAKELATRREALATEQRTHTQADGSPLTAEQWRQDSLDVYDYATFADEASTLKRILPTITYADTMTWYHGGRELRFMSVTGDQEGTTVLYLANERILLTGDAVSYPIPFVSAKPTAQVATLRVLAALHASVIVPGHGPAFHDNLFLDLERQWIESVTGGVAKGRTNGVTSVEAMQKLVTGDEFRDAFAHGDPDLETRYRDRTKALVELVMAE